MAVQNPFFGKREPETFQPRQPTIAQGSANGLNPAGNTSQTSSAAVVNTKAPVESTGSKLTVGPNIKLKGVEITDCDTLVVEGTVEATMDSRVIQISEQGAFRGSRRAARSRAKSMWARRAARRAARAHAAPRRLPSLPDPHPCGGCTAAESFHKAFAC